MMELLLNCMIIYLSDVSAHDTGFGLG